MKGIYKLGVVLTKVIEVVHWVAVGLMSAVGILSCAAPEMLMYVMDVEGLKTDGDISVYGFEVVAANSAGDINYTTLALFAVGAVIMFVLMALIFRNINLILKRSAASTPFSEENVKKLRQTGIFAVAVPVAGLVMSIIISLAVGEGASEVGVNIGYFAMGIVILCLTQFFAYGVRLEKDVDGLV